MEVTNDTQWQTFWCGVDPRSCPRKSAKSQVFIRQYPKYDVRSSSNASQLRLVALVMQPSPVRAHVLVRSRVVFYRECRLLVDFRDILDEKTG